MYGAASSSTAAIIPIHPRLATWLTRGQTCCVNFWKGTSGGLSSCPTWPDQGEAATNGAGVVRGAVASPQGAVHEYGGPAAVGAVVSASARPTLADERGAVGSSTGGVDENRPRATGGQTGLAAGLS